MASDKKPAQSDSPPAAGLSSRGQLLLALGVLACGWFVVQAAWRSWAPAVAASDAYRIAPENIELSPAAPPWVRSDLRGEALATAGLVGELSALDAPDRLQQRVADALRFHPWVRDVTGVVLTPPHGLRVSLEYRMPVAVAYAAQGGPASRWLPIDAEGYRLPAGDLSANELRLLPRIQSAGAAPLVGEPWEDPRLRGAVALIVRLGPAWRELRLVDVTPSPRPETRGASQHYLYTLRSSARMEIFWGAAPGHEPAGESTFEQKLSRLRAYIQQNGPIDKITTSPKRIEVRDGLIASERTVLLPAEPFDGDSSDAALLK
ncbi:hypothetical protein Mal64_05480 [Pseudobythopirellula maris]|uniref:Cell division protein FtsQ n=1 Tax=Pseudobythopirellula maris TaxID=2527991 RepID=A0A5C5ZRM9_9BACT|nr:hypothetical protein [Pseudobythopirellula maris]TWT90164.1 hypothetical protein Mal64_05480 [Pseudobythopirellula maris]